MPDPSAPMPPSAPAGQDWLAGASPRVRAMCAELRPRLFALDPRVSERISLRYCVYLMDGRPFAYVYPHGARLKLHLNLKRGYLENPDGIAKCISGMSSRGRSVWQIEIADGRDLERAMPLVRQAFKAAERRV